MASQVYSTVAGGQGNKASDFGATVSGGHHNHATGQLSFIGGGGRFAHGTPAANTAGGDYSVIGGGSHQFASGDYSFIGGGGFDGASGGNTAQGDYSIVVGGLNNLADGNYATIVGGADNKSSSIQSSIVGGNTNEVQIGANRAFIGAGTSNLITSNASSSIIGGGENNEIDDYAGVIAGGINNKIWPTNFRSFIGGGSGHDIGITGGSEYSVIAGGIDNETIGTVNTVGGGGDNVTDGNNSTIAGGESNRATSNWSSIGGGKYNVTRGWMSNMPGGEGLEADVYASTIVGSYNEIKGVSTWPPDPYDRKFVVGNGLSDVDRSNAFEVSNNGHSIVYHTNGTGTGAAGQAAIRGATYTDNVVYAWGSVTAAGGLVSDFGVASVLHIPGTNAYNITLNNREPDPNTGAASLNLSNGSVTATIVDETGRCGMITVSRLLGNSFTVYTYSMGGTASPECTEEERDFNFKVTGRP